MELTNRITWIEMTPDGGLLAADVTGRLHLLDTDLVLRRSSPARADTRIAAGAPIYTLTIADGHVITKDKLGTITRWSLSTLDPVDVLDAAATCRRDLLDEDEVPSPIMSRGIAVLDGKVYVNNGYRQLVVLDLETFTVEAIEPSPAGDNPIECINVDHPSVHVLSDQAGRLHLGDLRTRSFPRAVSLDAGNVHGVRYDPRWDRFWATLEESHDTGTAVSNGLVTLSVDGAVEHRLLFALDDVEVVALDSTASRVYCGGFDGELQVVDNTGEKPEVVRVLRGFPHQIITMVVLADDSLVVLTQDGEIVRLTEDGTMLARASWRRQCAWDLQPVLGRPDALYVACDDGVAVLEVGQSMLGPVPRVVAHHPSDAGFLRRLVPLPDGYVTLSRERAVARFDTAGVLRWSERLPGLLNDLALSPDRSRVLVAGNAGGWELDSASGTPVERFDIDGLPVWSAAYLDDGTRVLLSRDGRLCGFAPDSASVVWRLDLEDYPKRSWTADGLLWVTGENGVKVIEPYGDGVLRRYEELLYNTVENAVTVGGLVVAVSYGMQMAAYEADSAELVGLAEDLGDFAKSLAVLRQGDAAFVLVGGRGPVLGLYGLDAGPERGTFVKLRETLLPRRELGGVALTADVP